jgi:hypothetical protein
VNRLKGLLATLGLLVILVPFTARSARASLGTDIDLPNFASVANLTLNGNAAQVGNVLRVVPAAYYNAGSAYYNSPVATTDSFETTFQFLLHDATGAFLGPADAVTFTLQNQGLQALGPAGGWLGIPTTPASFTVALRDYSYNASCAHVAGSTVGVITYPNANPAPTFCPAASTQVAAPFSLYNTPVTAWIDYDAGSHSLAVFLSTTSTKPAAPVLTTTVNLSTLLGPSAYIGFTAATGSGYQDADVLSWDFTNCTKSGNGFGDKNHVHCGPPGQEKK